MNTYASPSESGGEEADDGNEVSPEDESDVSDDGPSRFDGAPGIYASVPLLPSCKRAARPVPSCSSAGAYVDSKQQKQKKQHIVDRDEDADDDEAWLRRAEARQHQIDIGKARPEYENYISAVPVESRTRSQPRTPDPHNRIPKRQFDRVLGEWRRALHDFGSVKVTSNSSTVQRRIAGKRPIHVPVLQRTEERRQASPGFHDPPFKQARRNESLRKPISSADGELRKHTCKFLIGINNDKEFQVARRIIGRKGEYMKWIVEETEAKIRLRGAGSGYLEGADQKESTEPLQLCVSCTDHLAYEKAVSHVTNLLNRVYIEYREFCEQLGRPVPALRINMSSNALPGGGNRQTPMSSKRPAESWPPVEKASSVDPDFAAEIERLIRQRNDARRAKDFAEADRIRALLSSRGVVLMDEPHGHGHASDVTRWRLWHD